MGRWPAHPRSQPAPGRAGGAAPSDMGRWPAHPRSQQQGDALDGSPAQVGHGQRQQHPEVPGDPGGGGHGRGGASKRPRLHRLAARRAGTIGAHRAGGQVTLAGWTPGHNRQAKGTPVPTPGLGPRVLEGVCSLETIRPLRLPCRRWFGVRESVHPNDPVRSGSVSPLVRVLSGLTCFQGVADGFKEISENFRKYWNKGCDCLTHAVE